jgi:exopolysaccharide production protein ExoZ
MIIPGIQYLRALAALAVVAFHAGQGARYAHAGHRGVDVFFVISGFIVTYTTAGKVRRALDPAPARAFLVRRLVRIVPLYWACLSFAVLHRLRRGAPPASLALDYLFVAHPHFKAAGHCWPYLVPGWSLNFEVFFYALFALTMLAGRRHPWLAAALMLSLAGLGSVLPVTGVARFYLAPFGAEFSLGIALAMLHRRGLRPPVWLAQGVCALGAVCLFSPHANAQLVDALLAGAIVWGALYGFDRVALPRLSALGDASYATYLVHTEVVGLLRGYVFVHVGMDDPNTPAGMLGVLVCVGASQLVGLLVHQHVERPLTQLFQRRLPLTRLAGT